MNLRALARPLYAVLWLLAWTIVIPVAIVVQLDFLLRPTRKVHVPEGKDPNELAEALRRYRIGAAVDGRHVRVPARDAELAREWVRHLQHYGMLAVVLLFTGCGILEPATEIRVENETGATLDVRVWGVPRGDAVPVFLPDPHYRAVLSDGAIRTWQVPAGTYRVEGWDADARAGFTIVDVKDATLRRVVFHEDGAIRGP